MKPLPMIAAVVLLSTHLGPLEAQDDMAVKPKGYDDSFQTGDIPKPKEPELDPDLNSDNEISPDKSPEANPDNDTSLDRSDEMVRIGGSAAISIPHVLNLGLETMIQNRFGISLNYGNATRSLNSVDVGIQHADLRLRWFPWSTSLFFGVGLGVQKLNGELNRVIKDGPTGQNISVRGKLNASANFIAPHFGWFAVWESGLTLGCDFGYLIPSSSQSSFAASFGTIPSGVSEDSLRQSSEFKEMRKDLEDSAKRYASRPMPFITLMRIGWML